MTAAPDFAYTKIFYTDSRTPTTHPSLKPADNPGPGQPKYVVDPATGSPIPDNNVGIYVSSPKDNWGKFTGTTTTTINFNNYTDGNPANTLPNLVPCANADWETSGTCGVLTYYFTSVAYDRCGNASNPAALRRSLRTEQCNDGLPGDATYGAPTWSLTPGKFSYRDDGNILSQGCRDYINLAWDEINSAIADDLAGYHIYRCEGYTCPAGTGEERTLGTPVWYPQFQDAVTNGTIYSYRVEATDCFYERGLNDPVNSTGWQNNYSFDTIEQLSVGGLSVDATMPKAVTGYLSPDTPALPVHRERRGRADLGPAELPAQHRDLLAEQHLPEHG